MSGLKNFFARLAEVFTAMTGQKSGVTDPRLHTQ
jgi:hypothetical protein